MKLRANQAVQFVIRRLQILDLTVATRNSVELAVCSCNVAGLECSVLSAMLVHGQVTIIFVVSVCLSVCLFVCLCRVFLSRL